MAGAHDGSPRTWSRQTVAAWTCTSTGQRHAALTRIASCCDAKLVSPLTRTGQPQPCSADVDGAALHRRAPQAGNISLAAAGPQRLVILGAEVGGWCTCLVRDLVRFGRIEPHTPSGAPPSQAGHRWWSVLSVAMQQSVVGTALGNAPPLELERRGIDAISRMLLRE